MTTMDSLRAEALAARAAKRHNEAVDVWRMLLDARPDDWRLALEMKHDLQEAWHNPDSDTRFRRAARAMPDAEWIEHYSASLALPGAELDAIRVRAGALAGVHAADARLQGVLGQVARQERDWDEAARAFAAAAALEPSHADWPLLAAEARQYARMEAVLNGFEDSSADYALTVINLDRNTERMDDTKRQCQGFPVLPERLAGVVGAQLPDAAVARLTGDAAAPRGTLGCFLSHASAWERLLAGTAAAALVLEDDAAPMLRFPARFSRLGLPEEWDVIWVNERMQRPRDADGTFGFSFEPVVEAVLGFQPWHDAVGTDGYLVSRAGARKLLDWTASDGFAGNVDWRMLAYALTPEEVGLVPRAAAARGMLEEVSVVVARAERLQAYAMHPALVREVSLRSDRQDDDRRHRDELARP